MLSVVFGVFLERRSMMQVASIDMVVRHARSGHLRKALGS